MIVLQTAPQAYLSKIIPDAKSVLAVSQLLKHKEGYQQKPMKGENTCGFVLRNHVLIYILNYPDDMTVVTLVLSPFTWSLENSVSRKWCHVKKQLLMINVSLVGLWLASGSWDHLIGSDTSELERGVCSQGPQRFFMSTSYMILYQIFIEGPLRHGDLEKLGKQVEIGAREWTTQKESIIWESNALHGQPA